MSRYLARRLLQLVPVFFGATFLIYALVFTLPGDPIRALSGGRPISEATINALRERYNLNDPLPVQYAKYIGGVLTGDFGESFTGEQVSDILARTIPVTVRLAAFAFIVEGVIGIAAGVLAAIRKGAYLDNLVLVSTTLVVSIPVFVLGFCAQLLLGVELGWFPVAFTEGWYGYLLPATVLAALSMAYIARLTRTSLAENLRADYVRTATAKGLPRSRVVGRHALRNSLIPVVTFLGVDLGNLMAGAIVTEGIFNVPGVGREVFEAVQSQEGPVVVGIVTFLVIVFIAGNLVVDILYGVLDPRIQYE